MNSDPLMYKHFATQAQAEAWITSAAGKSEAGIGAGPLRCIGDEYDVGQGHWRGGVAAVIGQLTGGVIAADEQRALPGGAALGSMVIHAQS